MTEASVKAAREVRGLFLLSGMAMFVALYFWSQEHTDADGNAARIILTSLFGIPGLAIFFWACLSAWQRYRPLGTAFDDRWRETAGPAVGVMMSGGPPMPPAKELGIGTSLLHARANMLGIHGLWLSAALAAPAALNWASQLPARRRSQAESREVFRAEALARLAYLQNQYERQIETLTLKSPRRLPFTRRWRRREMRRATRWLELTTLSKAYIERLR